MESIHGTRPKATPLSHPDVRDFQANRAELSGCHDVIWEYPAV